MGPPESGVNNWKDRSNNRIQDEDFEFCSFNMWSSGCLREIYTEKSSKKEKNLYGPEDWKRWLGFKIQGYKSSTLIAMSTVLSKDTISGINEST